MVSEKGRLPPPQPLVYKPKSRELGFLSLKALFNYTNKSLFCQKPIVKRVV